MQNGFSAQELNQDSSFFGDVSSYMCKLIKAIKLRITGIHQVTGSVRDLSPRSLRSGETEDGRGERFPALWSFFSCRRQEGTKERARVSSNVFPLPSTRVHASVANLTVVFCRIEVNGQMAVRRILTAVSRDAYNCLFIESRNASLLLVPAIFSLRNSMASRAGI